MYQPIDKMQRPEPRQPGDYDKGEASRQDSPPELLDLLTQTVSIIARQYPVILFLIAIFVSIAAVYVVVAPRSYTAQATMIIDPRRVQMFQPTPPGMPAPVFDAAAVESQLEVLRSENIAIRVIDKLRLLEDEEFTDTGSGIVSIVVDKIRGLFRASEPPTEAQIKQRAVNAFRERLRVSRVGLTHVIAVAFTSRDPDRSAEIANTAVDAYIVDQLDARFQSAKRAGGWLEERLTELQGQLAAAEQAVIDFKAQHNIVQTSGTAVDELQVADINSRLVLARAQTAEATAKLERIEQIIRTGNPEATVTDALTNPVINGLRTRLVDAIGREALWTARYGQDHLAVINLRNEIRELRRSLLDELKRIAATYESEFEIAKAREVAIRSALSDSASRVQTTGQAQITLRELEAAVKAYRTLYDTFQQRHAEALQQESFPISDTRTITRATRPLGSSEPRVALVLGLALFAGLASGVGIAVLRHLLDRVIRTTDQIERLSGVECLAILPLLPQPKGKRRRRAGSRSAGGKGSAGSGPRKIAPQQHALSQVLDEPFSRYTEAVRSIKVAIDLSAPGQKTSVVGITSSLPNEGKSTVAINLAQLIAQTGRRTILVDCDLRNPSVSRSLAPSATSGIIEVVSGKIGAFDVIWTDPATQLDFLPVVLKSRRAHTSELMLSQAMADMFAHLRTMYDYVIVDLPPLAPIVDTRASIDLVDSFVYVVEWGVTKIDVIEHVLNRNRAVQERLLGMTLNKVDMSALSRFEMYRTDYYSNKYYSRYGYTD